MIENRILESWVRIEKQSKLSEIVVPARQDKNNESDFGKR